MHIAYSRRPDATGYYLAYPPLERAASPIYNNIDWGYITQIRQMAVAEKNQQTFAAAEFALRQKRLLLRR